MKAPTEDILNFAAWHLEAGAQRIYIFLDDPAPDTEAVLAAHPNIRVTVTDADYWASKGGRPEKHQERQTRNARNANNKRPEVDWLTHIDVDEFLLPGATTVSDHLKPLPSDCLCARVRPIEALSEGDGVPPGETAFKAFLLDRAARQSAAERCYPTWGAHLPGGFLSHVAGKLFFRSGLKGLQIRIHNVFLDGVENPGQVELPDMELAHMHAKSWEDWMRSYRFRLTRGSYRAELKPQVKGSLTNLHALFQLIEQERGEAGLRAFYDEVCAATPDLCRRLEDEGLLRRHHMDFAPLRQKHFGR